MNPIPLEPFKASKGFSATVEGNPLDPNAQYTLVIQDAGFFFLHGIYINIPGDNFDIKNGQVGFECLKDYSYKFKQASVLVNNEINVQ